MIDLPESMDIEKDEFNRNRDHFKVIEKKRFMITYGDEDDDENNDREYDAKNNDNDNDNTNNMNDHNNNNDDETKNDWIYYDENDETAVWRMPNVYV